MPQPSAGQVGSYPLSRSGLPFVFLFLVLLLTALACDLNDVLGSKPSAIITSPPSGSTFHEGEDIAVQSVSTDAKGIARVDLLVDDDIVRTDTAPSPQSQFTIIQTWKATAGSHKILVRAYNTANVASDLPTVSIQVLPAIAGANPSPTGSAPPTAAPSITPSVGACTNSSVFLTDVTVPDGAAISAGQTFNKIWRLSNNGTCAWSAGYQFVFSSGEAMTPNTVIAVPNTAPGATADLLVPMTAPTAAGTHTGSWRLRSSGGALFGTTVTVKITVPGAVSTPTNTPASTSCSGNPVIASFTGPSNPITAGTTVTLTWGAVTNADTVEINQGIGGIGTPGSTTVTPASTTTFIMTAHCGANAVTSQVTVTVNPATIVNYSGHWDSNFGPLDLSQTGANVSGSFSNGSCTGTISGTVTAGTLDGTWGGTGCGSGNVHFVMAGGGNRWDGSWAGTNKWCASRAGLALALGCGFAGHWNVNYGNVLYTSDLTQIGNSVTGVFGSGGTISGTVTGWTLNGTWNINPASGSFVWVIDSGGNLFFRGSYGPPAGANNWCGWRDETSQPSQCHN